MKPNKSQIADVPPAKQKRKARIQPHAALGVAVSCLAAGAFVAYAATGGQFSFPKSSYKAPVPMKNRSVSSSSEGKSGAKAQLLGETQGAKKGGFLLTQTGGSAVVTPSSIVSDGRSGNNLTEIDLTPNTQSDERDASYSPNGEYIAFRSNGIDANGDGKLDATGFSADGKYHIWVGRFQPEAASGGSPVLTVYQVTGKNRQYLSGYDQLRPTWSPNGKELAFVSNSSIDGGQASGEQVYRINLNLQNDGAPQPEQPYNLTIFAGEKRSPVWSLNGTEITFAAKFAGGDDNSATGSANGGYDLFRISSNGQATLFRRITGGTGDTGAAADDLNPAYSLVQQDVIYFSSNRLSGAGRRIYVIRNDGTGLQQVTNPTLRAAGALADNDDFPALSSGETSNEGTELLAFQSNSYIDSSDRYKDRNIWGFSVDSRLVGAAPAPPTARFFVSVLNQNKLLFVNPPTDTTTATEVNIESGSNVISQPDGVLYYQNSGGSYVYVSSRNNNRVERLDSITGDARPGTGLNNTSFTPAEPPTATTPTGVAVPSPSGLATDGTYLYVASGTDLKNAVYRYSLTSGAPAGMVTGTGTDLVQTARFTFGEPTDKPLGDTDATNVSKGITINRARTRMYVSNFAKNRVNIYTLTAFIADPNTTFNQTANERLFQAGEWLGEIVAPKASSLVFDPDAPAEKLALLGPTGVAIGPDMSGDGIEDLYVASSGIPNVSYGGDDILAFALDANGATKPLPNGDQFKIIAHDDNASQAANLNAPEGIRFDSEGTLYVASNGGESINRFVKSGTGAASTWTAAGFDATAGQDDTANAAWLEFPVAPGTLGTSIIQGPKYFDFNPAYKTSYINTNGPDVPPSTFGGEERKPTSTLLTDNSAYVITNVLSSPTNYAASDLNRVVYDESGKALTVNVKEDKSADIEATFGRGESLGATLRNRVRVVFSSNRKYAPLPSSNGAGAVASNPTGGDDVTTGIGNPATNCDLWITAAIDVEAPVIQPEENNYPMLSPTHDATKYKTDPRGTLSDIGPRTARDGLTPGSKIKLALLAKENGSGLAKVSFAFFNAEDRRRFVTDRRGNPINETLYGFTRREVSPSQWPAVSGFGFNDAGMTLDLSLASEDGNYYSDQGPRGTNPERQSNAVAGDGIYYLSKKVPTPTTAGDYFISVRMTDRQGNYSEYDFIWGFSTKLFSPSPTNDLFVSDNTAGQQTTIVGKGTDESSASLNDPVESFYLNNWGSDAVSDVPYIAGTVIDGENIATSTPVTFDNVDVWRVLCRGPIDEDIVTTNYIPSTVTQINPDKFDNGFQTKDKVFANVQRVVLWAAPYAGTAEVEFDIPGSIKEGATKQQLKRLLEGGGRLFLTGRNVLTALDEGGADNSFRGQELYATAAGKVNLRVAGAILPDSGTNAFPELDLDFLPPKPRPDYSNPQFGYFPAPPTEDYRDGSYSHSSTGASTDSYTPGSGTGVQIFQAYTNVPGESGAPVGQRIIKKRSTDIDSGLESRVVFFSFNFDGVNRRYTRINNVPVALDVRKDMADGIRTWFKTGTFSGRVIDNTGVNVPNALVYATAGNDVYFARTDATGFYEFKGLPAGRIYSAFMVFNDDTFDTTPDGQDDDANDRDDLPADDVNRNYFTGTGAGQYLYAGATAANNIIRVQKVSPGSIAGKVYTYAGSGATDNPLDRTLHSPIGGIQVLLTVAKSSTSTSTAPVYARLTRTAATGSFSFADAPPARDLVVILNPKATDIPANSDLKNPSDPTDTQVTYNKEYGRRVIPLDGDKRRTGDVVATQNDTFVINDTYVFDATKTSLSEYPNPATDTAADEKGTDGLSLPVVLTRGEPISGKFTLQAGKDSLRFGAGWVVKLISTDTPARATRQVVTKADGSFTFDEVIFGNYRLEGTVPADVVNGYDKLTAVLTGINTDTLTDATRLIQNLQAKISHLQGYVKVNGAYVSGATVTLKNLNGTTVEFGGIKREGKTGNVANNANYFIPFVPDGTYNVVATLADGTTTKTETNVVFDSTPTTPNLSIVRNFDFTVSQVEVTISTLYAGLAKDDVTVNLYKTTAPNTVYKTLKTDANGKVTFIGVDPGNYNITASKTINGVTATASLANKNVTGATTPVALTLKWDSLKGTVRLNGSLYEGARIQFFLGTTELTALELTTDSNGAFEAGKTSGETLAKPLAPGTYRVRASLVVGGLTQSQEKTVTLSATPVGQIVSVGDFNFVPAYLTGKVLLNGAAGSGFNVVLYNSNNTLFKDDGGVGRSAVTDATGAYRLDYVPAGTNNFIVKATKQFNTITAAGQVTVPTVNASGETKAGNINITIANGLRGQVTVNGVGTAGARLQVLLKKVPVGSAVVTDASGNYFITGLADGSYKLNADYSEGGFALKTLSKSFTVKKGVYKANVINFAFKVTRLTGNVTVNGKSVAGVGVTLLDSKGKALKTPVSGTTDANGKYILSGVKAATYRIQATFGTSTNYVTQKVGNLATTVAPTIALTRQELEATTVVKIGTSTTTRILPGATVEILSSTGNSLGAAYTATSDANGKATFYGLANGSYRARVSAQGVTTTTIFSVGTGLTAQTFPITLSQASGLLSLSESNNLRTTELGGIDIMRVSLLVKPTSNVVVTLTANTPAEAIFTTGTTATLTFTTTNWNVAQTVTLVGQQDNQADGDEPFTIGGKVTSTDSLFAAIPAFTLSGTNFEVTAAPTTGPTFPANSKTLVSTPFTAIDGTLPVSTVFGTSGYTLYRFNASGQKAQFLTSGGAFPGADWVAMSGTSKMERGRGYLLVTGSAPVTMLIPANPTVFSGDTFAVDVVRNKDYKAQTGAASDINNGYDLVGFPFDPTTVAGFNIFESQVLAEGILYGSYAEAAAAGKVSNRIYTVDSLGRPKELAPGDSTIRPYRGYFVKIFVDSAKIIMKASPSNGSGSGSGSSASVSKTSAKSS